MWEGIPSLLTVAGGLLGFGLVGSGMGLALEAILRDKREERKVLNIFASFVVGLVYVWTLFTLTPLTLADFEDYATVVSNFWTIAGLLLAVALPGLGVVKLYELLRAGGEKAEEPSGHGSSAGSDN